MYYTPKPSMASSRRATHISTRPPKAPERCMGRQYRKSRSVASPNLFFIWRTQSKPNPRGGGAQAEAPAGCVMLRVATCHRRFVISTHTLPRLLRRIMALHRWQPCSGAASRREDMPTRRLAAAVRGVGRGYSPWRCPAPRWGRRRLGERLPRYGFICNSVFLTMVFWTYENNSWTMCRFSYIPWFLNHHVL
jgi:hypothetical protein